MRHRALRARLAILAVALLAAGATTPAGAVTIDPFAGGPGPAAGPDATDPEALIRQLLQGQGYGDAMPGALAQPITNEQQARRALSRLEVGLRRQGDLYSIAVLAPAIRAQLPTNQRLDYLYAIALAAFGDPLAAGQTIEGLETTEDNRLYAALAGAMIAKAAGDLPAAARQARAAMAIDPDHPYPHNILGQMHAEQGRLEEAVARFRRAVALAPEFAAAYSNLGAAYFLQDRLVEAVEAYDRALDLAPEHCPARIGRAAVEELQGAYAAAVADLEPCASGPEAPPSARQRLVTLYLRAGQPGEAKALAESLLASDPEFARTAIADAQLRMGEVAAARATLSALDDPGGQAVYLLGLCDLLEGRPDDAVARLDAVAAAAPQRAAGRLAGLVARFYAGQPFAAESLQALAADPEVGKLAAFVAGAAEAADGDWAAAKARWGEAEGLLPGFTLAGVTAEQLAAALSPGEQRHLALGMLLYLRQMYPSALGRFEAALAENADSFLGHYLAATTQRGLGAGEAAESHLMRSVEAVDSFFPVSYSLAEIAVRRGEVERAIAYYEAAAAAMPDAGVLVKLGLLYEGRGELAEAEDAYRRFLAHYPENYIAHNQLAWFYAKRGERLEEAMRLARRADQLRPGNASVNDTLGWIHYQRGEMDEALRRLDAANRIARGRNPDVLFHLAAVKSAQGERSAALALLEEAIGAYPRFESRKEAERLRASLAGAGD